MTTPNPLLPQGTLQDFHQEKVKTRIWIISIIFLHVLVICGLLIQGCKSEDPGSQKIASGPVQDEGPQEDAEAIDTPSIDDLPQIESNRLYDEDFYDEDLDPEAAMEPAGARSGDASGEVGSRSETLEARAGSGPSDQAERGGGSVTGTDSANGDGSQEESTEFENYEVQPNDTFYEIGQEFGVSLARIREANPGVQPKRLQPGQTLRIPTGGDAAANGSAAPNGSGSAAPESGSRGGGSEMEGASYTVQKGDSLYRIARDHGVTASAIRNANDLDSNVIHPGDRLRIPNESDED